jgi:alanine racemase
MVRIIFRLIRKRCASYAPLVSVRVYQNILRANCAAFQRSFSTLAIAPVLKSNAYGHGLVEVAHIFEHDRLPFFCIDTYVEALILRNEGITTPLLILGYSLPENIARSRLRDVAFSIGSIEMLKNLAEARSLAECHLTIDTGMHRQGIRPEEIPDAIATLKSAPHIRLTGIMSHLADADGDGSSFTEQQIAQWNACAAQLKEHIPSIRFIHCSATAGSRYAKAIDANVLRLGIGLYGCAEHIPVPVQPALELVSLVSAIRAVRPGEKIGYNITYTASREMRVATVPLGYAEGVDRRLSNRGSMLVRGLQCPIVGRVSMNMTTLDVTDVVPTVRVGDEVIAIGRMRDNPNSCESIARLCGTIPYEILVHIPSTLRRIVV